MTKYQAVPEGYMTVGEAAKKMGVTVRTLQYYDREGLLRPSRLSEGGRRLYGDRDIVRLHQILSLKYLGFSIEEIKNRFSAMDTPNEVAAVLTEQGKAIQAQIDALSQKLREIEILKTEVLQMQTVDFKRYADIIVNLQMKNEAYGLIKFFDDETLDMLHKRYDRESGLAMLNRFKALRNKIIECANEGVPPESQAGQALAKEFWEMITEFTGGDMSMLPRLMKMGEADTGSEAWMREQEKMNAFIEPALNAYFKGLGVNPLEDEQ